MRSRERRRRRCRGRSICSGSLSELASVDERLTITPGVVLVREIDALSERRMAFAKDRVEQSRPWVRQSVLLQLHERRAGAVIRLRDLQGEAVRLVLDMAGVG